MTNVAKQSRAGRVYRRTVSLSAVVAVILLFSSGSSGQKKPARSEADKADDEIVAAVVRNATLSKIGIVFLQVNNHDPSVDTLRRLSAWRALILPFSRAVYVPASQELGYYKDRKTGQPGELFYVEGVKQTNSTQAEVAAGWWQACGTYIVVFKNGSWSVETYKAWSECF